MAIMRSPIVRGFFRIMKDKVKRKHVNWIKVIQNSNNMDLHRDFCDRLSRLYHGRSLSVRRCAYYTLKNYYHTTTIDELRQKIGF